MWPNLKEKSYVRCGKKFLVIEAQHLLNIAREVVPLKLADNIRFTNFFNQVIDYFNEYTELIEPENACR